MNTKMKEEQVQQFASSLFYSIYEEEVSSKRAYPLLSGPSLKFYKDKKNFFKPDLYDLFGLFYPPVTSPITSPITSPKTPTKANGNCPVTHFVTKIITEELNSNLFKEFINHFEETAGSEPNQQSAHRFFNVSFQASEKITITEEKVEYKRLLPMHLNPALSMFIDNYQKDVKQPFKIITNHFEPTLGITWKKSVALLFLDQKSTFSLQNIQEISKETWESFKT
eukprot:TRINITY_DN1596_c0_g1_i8.p1 TRINITY_DN1596_c0_g1~~TRINITY_DN1596_c0_g1_i8.p1  ORF type:complete len:224 (+),score=63.22 TRINITY_DN1596_c0_g1_i8:59-730(+)